MTMFSDHQHHDVTRHAALMIKSRRFWLIWLIPIAAVIAETPDENVQHALQEAYEKKFQDLETFEKKFHAYATTE